MKPLLFFFERKIIPEAESELQTKIQPQKHPRPDVEMSRMHGSQVSVVLRVVSFDGQALVCLEAVCGDGGLQ